MQEDSYSMEELIFTQVIKTGDVMDSTLVHTNDFPVPIPIHQRGLILMKHDY